MAHDWGPRGKNQKPWGMGQNESLFNPKKAYIRTHIIIYYIYIYMSSCRQPMSSLITGGDLYASYGPFKPLRSFQVHLGQCSLYHLKRSKSNCPVHEFSKDIQGSSRFPMDFFIGIGPCCGKGKPFRLTLAKTGASRNTSLYALAHENVCRETIRGHLSLVSQGTVATCLGPPVVRTRVPTLFRSLF